MTPKINRLVQPYENCPKCDGTALVMNMAGEPDTCRECEDGLVRARDQHGRFLGNSVRWMKDRNL